MIGKTTGSKKKPKIMKKKLLNSLTESDTVKEPEYNIQNIINQSEAIDVIVVYNAAP